MSTYTFEQVRGGYIKRRDSEDPKNIVVLEDGGAPDDLLTIAHSDMHRGGLSRTTVNAYARGSLAFWSYRRRLLGGATSQDLLPWNAPQEIRQIFRQFLLSIDADVEPSTTEVEVWHVKAKDENASAVINAVCGVFHSFESLAAAGIIESNPLEVPLADRKAKRVPGFEGSKSGPLILPRFRFRIPSAGASALRTDASHHLIGIVPALVAYGAPTSIVMMIRTLIEGIARISEECVLTVWDWWEASQFGEAIDTTNKGDGIRRVKVQVFSWEHVGDLLLFFDGERRLLDREGWGLDDWRQYLRDETIPLRVRKAKAMASPMFPKKGGGFYCRSGVMDPWYRPAMKAAGLPTRSHYPRHCGVNDFLAYIDARNDLTPEEKDVERLEFAKGMGWKWPLIMLARYSLPQRRLAAFETRRRWLEDRTRHMAALADGAGKPPVEQIPVSVNDGQMSRLFRFATSKALAA